VQESKAKSRNLPLLEFFEILQLEWIQADLRHKVYPRPKDKLYWKRVMDGKKVNIETLGQRNQLPTIFSDSGMHIDLQKKVYRENSYPIFSYRDHDHELEQSYYDLKYYYNLGADVRIKTENGDVVLGKISREYIPVKHSNLYITIAGQEAEYPISKVTRIL